LRLTGDHGDVYEVVTELQPLRYWLVCGVCRERWPLIPDQRLLPQTREIFAEHRSCPQSLDLVTDTTRRAGGRP
jgi:hypothetical protein